jgi:tetratricopeptide (TPR) repeat protein
MQWNMKMLPGLIALAVAAALLIAFVLFTIRRAEEPRLVRKKWIFTVPLIGLIFLSVPLLGPFGPFLIVFCAIVLSYMWTPHLGGLISSPLTGIFDGGNLPPEPKPAYSTAIAKQKQGHYLDAVAEIRKQLDRFPTDVEGHMLLAQIQAEDLKDLPGAELTINRLCAQAGHAPKNIAFALYSIADWHLKHGRDPESAKRALERIIEMFPGTDLALGAAQRIAHLGTAEMLLAQHEPKRFAVPEGIRNVGLVASANQPKAVEIDPEKLAADYVKHLEQFPLDMEAREKLAVLYADYYGRLDMAASELEQMIGEPHQPPKLIIHWLNLLADLQIRAGQPYEVVRQTLYRIIEKYPNIAAAEIARNRLSLLNLELKSQQKNRSIKLGTYEQNIGLKRSRAA